MRMAEVHRNGILTGRLIEHAAQSYVFTYDDLWLADETNPAISLTLPRTQKSHRSDHLFPFFFNMLSEGANKKLQCRQLKIDEKDHFGLLLAIATDDTIGAITVKPIGHDQRHI